MIRLDKALQAWGTPEFSAALKRELKELDAALLPLQQGLSASSHVVDGKIDVMVISASAEDDVIRAKAGIFYAGIIAGCSCADDPTPVDEVSEYCEVELTIDRKTAQATVALQKG